MAAGQTLRAWLRKPPQPARVRIRTQDDEVRIIQLSEHARNRWGAAEEAIIAAGAVSVECLDANDAILRGQRLEIEVEDPDEGPGGDQERIRSDKLLSRERRDIAAIVDSVMRNQNESFRRGTEAANTGQTNLLKIVETLADHLSLAITNVHNISANYALAVTGSAAEDENPNQKLLAKVIELAGAKAAAQAQPPNGKRGKTDE
jgi:hypothetical protein